MKIIVTNIIAPVLQSIVVTPANPSIVIGGTQQFTATGTYDVGPTQNITSQVTWNSSNTSVATIGSSTGLATAVTSGTANITASFSGKISPAKTLTVTNTMPAISVGTSIGGGTVFCVSSTSDTSSCSTIAGSSGPYGLIMANTDQANFAIAWSNGYSVTVTIQHLPANTAIYFS